MRVTTVSAVPGWDVRCCTTSSTTPARGMSSLWLETGTTEDFAPARRLYASEGFVVCGPFEDYTLDPLSVFMTCTL